MPLQLFPSLPPVPEVEVALRDLIAQGDLIQHELVDISGLGTIARERSSSAPDRETLERWDRDGVLCPLTFVTADGPRTSWRTTEPYRTEGLHLREEHPFIPWEKLTSQMREPRPLYSPWQALYLPQARDMEGIEVHIEPMVAGGERLLRWTEAHGPFVEQHAGWRGRMHELWLPTVKLLVRLQPRFWPFVCGRSVMLIDVDTHDYVDALELEYRRTSAQGALGQLGVSVDTVRALYEWLALRAVQIDPAPDLYELLRLEPRARRLRRHGPARAALDFQDAAQMLRRFLRELTGALAPDLDQVGTGPVAPRPLRRDRAQLQEALRQAGLYPHRLHMVVEGATEERLIRRLFLAFAGPWEGSGLAITDLGGDKLEGSRPMLEGFAIYADVVALLLDDENHARRITEQLAANGVVVGNNVTLWQRSLEEDNFTPAELLAMVAELGRKLGAELQLTQQQLMQEQERAEARPAPRQALASTLQRLARRPEHGSVVYAKPDLAEPMADLIISEVEQASGGHEELAQRRPIVAWMTRYPLPAARG